MSAHYFYRLDSGLGVTNLQLFALFKATECWREIQDTPKEYRDQVRGPCAFVVATMGLSLSQLLGQNPVNLPDNRVDSPLKLFKAFAREHELGQELTDDFGWFMDYYDAVRHFGIVKDGSRHREVEGLTLDVTRRCFEIGVRVWEEVLAVHGRELGGRLDDLDLSDLDHLEFTHFDEDDPGPLAGSRGEVEKRADPEEQGPD